MLMIQRILTVYELTLANYSNIDIASESENPKIFAFQISQTYETSTFCFRPFSWEAELSDYSGWDVSFSYLYDAKISSYRSDYLVHVGP